jgi:hypothetical protein
MTRTPLLFALAVAATACGPDLTTPTGFLEAYSERVCELAHTFRDSYPESENFDFENQFGGSEGDCPFTLYVDVRALEASVATGRVAYSQADAEACLGTLEDIIELGDGMTAWSIDFDYDELPTDISGCGTTFIGKVGVGGVCATDFDCGGPEGYCDEGLCSDNK